VGLWLRGLKKRSWEGGKGGMTDEGRGKMDEKGER